MRIAIVMLIFIASLLLYGETSDVFAQPPMTRRDSLALAERTRALADFERRIMNIPKYRVECNYFYAEEILLRRYGIKADMHVFESFCGTGMEETWFREQCYENVIDSLMFAEFGSDIYERVSVAGDRLQKEFPDRYKEDDGLPGWKPLYDSDSVDARLARYINYPPAAKRDNVQGQVDVWVEYDSAGTVTSASIMKSVRADLDSAAIAGAMYIGKVNPTFRWGQHLPGEFMLPINFKLKD